MIFTKFLIQESLNHEENTCDRRTNHTKKNYK